jgi:riboflavin synthase
MPQAMPRASHHRAELVRCSVQIQTTRKIVLPGHRKRRRYDTDGRVCGVAALLNLSADPTVESFNGDIDRVAEGNSEDLSSGWEDVFTGIVEVMGVVERLQQIGPGLRIQVRCADVADGVQIGDSIAINGCCLTVVASEGDLLEFDAGEETLQKTNLGEFARGHAVNLERSLLASSRLDGHFVSGHIDCTGTVRSRADDGDWSTFWFQVPNEWSRFMAPKGSIAVDGISLTLVEVTDEAFSVALIPHTLQVTTLGARRPGDRVNIETDILAKYVQRLLASDRDAPPSVDEIRSP